MITNSSSGVVGQAGQIAKQVSTKALFTNAAVIPVTPSMATSTKPGVQVPVGPGKINSGKQVRFAQVHNRNVAAPVSMNFGMQGDASDKLLT